MLKLIAVFLATMALMPGAAAGKGRGSWNATHGVRCDYWRQSHQGAVVQCYDRSDWAADLSSHGRARTGQINPSVGGPYRTRPPRRWFSWPPGGVQCRRGPGLILVQCRNESGHGFRFTRHRHETW